MTNKDLPVFGFGPIYVISCLILTVAAIFLRNKSFLKNGYLPNLKYLAIILGLSLIIPCFRRWIASYTFKCERYKYSINILDNLTVGNKPILRKKLNGVNKNPFL